MKRICKNCAHFYNRKEKVCPHCGTPASSKFKDILSQKNRASKTSVATDDKINEKVDLEKLEEIASKVENKKTDTFNIDIPKLPEYERDKIKYVPKHKRIKDYVSDEIKIDGIHIDVSRISVFDKKYQTKNKYQTKGEYSTKKARGDYKLEKLKWWEIYRWADRVLVRRRIKKYVNKAAMNKPENVSYLSLLLLCVFTGYIGVHNIYAKNYVKGWVSFSLFSLSVLVMVLAESVTFFSQIQVSIGGFAGMIVFVMWAWDLIAIIFKKFKFKTSKLAYIKTLDVETRARLGNKYI